MAGLNKYIGHWLDFPNICTNIWVSAENLGKETRRPIESDIALWQDKQLSLGNQPSQGSVLKRTMVVSTSRGFKLNRHQVWFQRAKRQADPADGLFLAGCTHGWYSAMLLHTWISYFSNPRNGKEGLKRGL